MGYKTFGIGEKGCELRPQFNKGRAIPDLLPSDAMHPRKENPATRRADQTVKGIHYLAISHLGQPHGASAVRTMIGRFKIKSYNRRGRTQRLPFPQAASSILHRQTLPLSADLFPVCHDAKLS